ncbi:WhiB family transcriptional regulator [Mycobacterium sp. BK086]|uniref:WhiB family transcriptional regulator n=1 Tax=Mycobacterium sp. BK086 TaxID=2512165 RepID=UPI00105BB45C|nr:WhiB family transcriptional regulator [Mycobacterium sp. BK086]
MAYSDPEWRLRARCRGLPLEIFFVASTEKGARRMDHEDAAKRICRSCAVRQRCLSYAMEIDEQHGIWGATSPRERLAMRAIARSATSGA